MDRGTTGVLVVAVLAITAATPGAVAVSGVDRASPDEVDAETTNGGVTGAAPSGNNSSVAHRNPGSVSAEGDLTGAQRWLAREMASRLAESVDASQSDRERARELLANDSRYAELAEQYAEVSSETGGAEVGGERVDGFAAVGSVQREFLAAVQRYRETHGAYRTAREDDDDADRARRLAHELDRIAERVDRTGGRLNESYANLTSVEESEREAVRRDVGRIRANVTATQSAVVNATLVRTHLSLRAVEATGSFADPLRFAGRLRTADGEAVGGETVALRIGDRTVRTRTDDAGRFAVAYRPARRAVGEHRAPVSFRPTNQSAYASADATVAFAVEAVVPNVSVSTRPDRVAYGDALTVNGTVAVDGVGAPGVPVNATVGGVPVGTTETGPNGSFGLTVRIPTNVSDGARTVRVRVNQTGRALASAGGTARVAVNATPTALSITDTDARNGTAYVGGRLTTAGGAPVPNRTVRLAVNGTRVGSATTDATGAYETTVSVRERLRGDGATVRVVATYASPGNLEPARATATLAFSPGEQSPPGWPIGLGVAGLLGAAAVTAFVWRWRSGTGDDRGVVAALAGTTDLAGGPQPPAGGDGASGLSPDALLDAASDLLADDRYDAAVVTAYAAIRRRLADADGAGVARTHWELFEDHRDDLPPDPTRRLERVTETYERAAFATDSVAETAAEGAITDAQRLLRDGETDTADDHADADIDEDADGGVDGGDHADGDGEADDDAPAG